MKLVREIRYYISLGMSVHAVADLCDVSESTVRNYTKAIRERKKNAKEVG